uniref:Ycf39 n=1 Tax=Sargassum thunbergii TaxID=127542 RepID=A0A0Y0JAT7_9PHAE|nr:Ycf39 [Sargassum thunbergii]AMB49143.1 Ycf39 [Sargassum thunbergii]
MTLLILGGTGTLGRQIVRKALENGFQVRCIVRNKRAANFLKEWGAELVYGDLTLPETLPAAFQGITAVIDAATTKVTEENDNSSIINVDWYGKLIIIELSKLINIKRFIFLSILNSEKYPYITLMEMKYRVEKLIKSSGLTFTIFKYAGFFQSLINQYALPLLEQKPILVTSKSPAIAYIDTQDAAYFCIKSLSIKETQNKIFATGSSRAWKSEEIIGLCEKFSGQKAKTLMFSILFFKIFRQITGFFDWSLQISERLAFIEVINDTPNFKSSIQYTYHILDINPREILELDFYFQEYFEIMLKTLEEIKKTKASIIAT